MKRQISLLLALCVGVGAGLSACDDESDTTPTGMTTTGTTSTGTTSAGTTTGSTPTGTTTGTTPTGGSGGAGGGSNCVDADQPAYTGQGGGPVCYGTAGAGGNLMPAPASGFDAPNTQPQAVFLGNIEDGDSCGSTLQGVINGNTDVDWYHYHGTDESLTLVDPTRNRGADSDLVMCAYVECNSGETPTLDCTNSDPDTLGAGGGAMNGCCTDGDTTEFEIDLSLTGCKTLIPPSLSDSMNVYIKVSGESVAANACVPYSLDFHF